MTTTESKRKPHSGTKLKSKPKLVECPSCMGYGYFSADGEPTIDRRNRKCLDCRGEGRHVAGAGQSEGEA